MQKKNNKQQCFELENLNGRLFATMDQLNSSTGILRCKAEYDSFNDFVALVAVDEKPHTRNKRVYQTSMVRVFRTKDGHLKGYFDVDTKDDYWEDDFTDEMETLICRMPGLYA